MKAALLGGGVIGGGWAARFLLNGWDVAVFDPDPEAPRKIGEVLSGARASLPHLYERDLPAEGALSFATSLEDAVKGTDWVQESAPERLELKQRLLAQATAAAPGAIVASSTSGFKPSDLAANLDTDATVLVAHPFNPVYLLPLVELVATPRTPGKMLAKAKSLLESIGMHPLHIKAEIDAHIADRLLEAVWREALWLIKDDIATTEEIDEAIRLGFGLRWAQMGLFETYRIAGGEAGMAHFLAQFGPALKWPWTKLMDVPDLDEALVQKIADQSDAQSGAHAVRELERIRDKNLVAILRALKARGYAAGEIIARHERGLPAPSHHPAGAIRTVSRTVPVDWADYNGHMNESRYGQVYSDAADEILARIGAGEAYVAAGYSFFTVDIHITFQLETHVGQHIHVDTTILEAGGKKLRLRHEMKAEDGTLLSTGEQLLIHVSLSTRKSCLPVAPVDGALNALSN